MDDIEQLKIDVEAMKKQQRVTQHNIDAMETHIFILLEKLVTGGFIEEEDYPEEELH